MGQKVRKFWRCEYTETIGENSEFQNSEGLGDVNFGDGCWRNIGDKIICC